MLEDDCDDFFCPDDLHGNRRSDRYRTHTNQRARILSTHFQMLRRRLYKLNKELGGALNKWKNNQLKEQVTRQKQAQKAAELAQKKAAKEQKQADKAAAAAVNAQKRAARAVQIAQEKAAKDLLLLQKRASLAQKKADKANTQAKNKADKAAQKAAQEAAQKCNPPKRKRGENHPTKSADVQAKKPKTNNPPPLPDPPLTFSKRGRPHKPNTQLFFDS
jgi:hypothetical protein